MSFILMLITESPDSLIFKFGMQHYTEQGGGGAEEKWLQFLSLCYLHMYKIFT